MEIWDNHFHEIKVAELRGYIIHYSIALEKTAEKLILKGFFGDDTEKLALFNDCYVNRAEYGFKAKLEVLSKVLKAHHPKILKEYPFLATDLDQIPGLRNDAAHGHFNFDDEKEWYRMDYELKRIGNKRPPQDPKLNAVTFDPQHVLSICGRIQRAEAILRNLI